MILARRKIRPQEEIRGGGLYRLHHVFREIVDRDLVP